MAREFLDSNAQVGDGKPPFDNLKLVRQHIEPNENARMCGCLILQLSRQTVSAKAGARERGRWFGFSTTVHELSQSNRPCNIRNLLFWASLRGSSFPIFCLNHCWFQQDKS